jgi:hypothetical protein
MRTHSKLAGATFAKSSKNRGETHESRTYTRPNALNMQAGRLARVDDLAEANFGRSRARRALATTPPEPCNR